MPEYNFVKRENYNVFLKLSDKCSTDEMLIGGKMITKRAVTPTVISSNQLKDLLVAEENGWLVVKSIYLNGKLIDKKLFAKPVKAAVSVEPVVPVEPAEVKTEIPVEPAEVKTEIPVAPTDPIEVKTEVPDAPVEPIEVVTEVPVAPVEPVEPAEVKAETPEKVSKPRKPRKPKTEEPKTDDEEVAEK
jgi:hypothetical protein